MVVDQKEIERLKARFLELHGDELFKAVSKVVNDWEEEGSPLSFDALIRASSQDPRLAAEVCPQLVQTGDLEHLRLFMYLLPDLWVVSPGQMKILLAEALCTSDSDARQLVEEMFEEYCDPEHPLGSTRKGFAQSLRRLMGK